MHFHHDHVRLEVWNANPPPVMSVMQHHSLAIKVVMQRGRRGVKESRRGAQRVQES
jgi:hypothetical protein